MSHTHTNGTTPHTALHYKQLGNTAYTNKQLSAATQYFTAAIELLNSQQNTAEYDVQLHSIVYSNRSAIHLEQYNYTAALADAQSSIQLNKQWYKSYLRQAQAYYGLEQYSDAITSYNTALSLQPDIHHITYIHNELQNIQSIVEYNTVKQYNSEIQITNHIEQTPHDDYNNQRYHNLIDWLLTDTTTVLNKLYIKSYSYDSRGVCALQHIQNNEIILKIPLQYIITSELARNSYIGQSIISSQISLNSSHTFLACYLLYEKYIECNKSQWYYYIQCLPESYSNMPIFFPQTLIDTYLQGSFTVQKINDRKTELYDEYTNLCQKIPIMKQFTLDQFIWARLVVITRIFGLVINERKTDGLVPLADLLNHKRPRETSWNFDDGTQCFTITSLCQIEQYSAVYDSYGRKCNSRFFVNYGFSLDNNFDDNNAVLYIPCNESVYDNYTLKCRLYGMNPATIDKIKRFQISTDLNDKLTKDLYSFLRLYHCNSIELIQLQQNNELNTKDLPPISLQNELHVLHTIYNSAKYALSQFPDTLDTDNKLLQEHRSGITVLDDNIYNCIVQRKGEKEVLQWYIQLYEHMSELSTMSLKQIKKWSLSIELGRPQMDKYLRDIFLPLLKQAQRM